MQPGTRNLNKRKKEQYILSAKIHTFVIAFYTKTSQLVLKHNALMVVIRDAVHVSSPFSRSCHWMKAKPLVISYWLILSSD